MAVIPLHQPPSRKVAQNLIREYAAAGKIAVHSHCKLRQRQRKITFLQILNVLAKGFVTEDPYASPVHHGWETSVIGRSAGTAMKIVVCLRWSQDVLVVTCYETGGT